MVIAAPHSPARSISILGSTGSIGKNTLSVIEEVAEAYKIRALTAHSNVAQLAEQAIHYRAEMAVISNEDGFAELKERLAGSGIIAAAGANAVIEAASLDHDIVMAAIMGSAGLAPVIAAIRKGATIALANKECLVCGGEWLIEEAKKYKATLLPVDSEHNAIFQLLAPEGHQDIESITLTASGGPFRLLNKEQMANITPAEAVNHPNWKMGAKISIDSATLMNKGLELIEAYYLFPVKEEQITILVHPESIIHGLISYRDGSVLAQMASPDMRIPISYALSWPNRSAITTKPLDLATLGSLNFEHYNPELFPAPELARQALRSGGTAAIILNSANEVAVGQFMEEKIAFLDIASLVAEAMASLSYPAPTQLDDIYEIDQQARRGAMELAQKFRIKRAA